MNLRIPDVDVGRGRDGSSGPRHVLGISAFYHDSAACLVRDGEIVAAAQEERFSRKKGDAGFPARAIDCCLRAGGIGVRDLDAVGYYEKPLLKFERILENYLRVAPKGFRSFRVAGPLWMTDRLFIDRQIREALAYDGPLFYAEHHESHAASAFYPSPFGEAAIVTVDGVGEWATASIGIGRGADIELLEELHWPDSLGLLYSAFTAYLGFKVNSGEYKVMGLAPYGEPKYVDLILRELVDLREDGSFRLHQRYFNYASGLTMTNREFDGLFGGPPRVPESALTRRDMDLARSIQAVCEEILLRVARTAHRKTGMDNLVLAGGVALNSVGNGRILREGPFRRLWVQPAAGDAGGAVGVALLIWHRQMGNRRSVTAGRDGMSGSLLGPAFGPGEIEETLRSMGARYARLEREELLRRVAGLLSLGKVVGWFDGRMEFGPRALGSRSILGDPRDPGMQVAMNRKVKFREDFRPLAPSVVRERAGEYFDLEGESPYMALVAPVREGRGIPAVTHVDSSARVQTVAREANPNFHDLIREFARLTGCAVLVNTSFNVRGEPIVCDPADAYRCFLRTGIDHLVAGPFLLDKEEQPEWKEGPGPAPGNPPRWTTGGGGWLGALLWAWTTLGRAIAKITTPILLGLIYFAVITPTGLALSLFEKNARGRENGRGTYWVPRPEGNRRSRDMTRRF